MRDAQGVEEVLNAVENEDAFFAIHRNGECVAVMITPSLFEKLLVAIYKNPVKFVAVRGQAPEVW